MEEVSLNTNNYEDMIMNFENVVVSTCKYDSFKNAEEAVYELIFKSNSELLCRNKDINTKTIINNFDINYLREVIKKSSPSDDIVVDNDQLVMNYFTDLFNRYDDLKCQVEFVSDACSDTLRKYDFSGIDGQTSKALNNYIETGMANGFTNRNDSRSELIKYVNYKNIPFILQIILNSERSKNNSYSYHITRYYSNEQLCDLYTYYLSSKLKENDRLNALKS